ncbi:MAG: IS200/IS605 family transposase [Alloprevotella sp.]|nr:IS200/IS605 family transposase [Alloprevotella sp.]
MSYTRLIYHIVFRTKDSRRAITIEHERELYRYIWGFVRSRGAVLGRIGGMPDHIHLLVEIPPEQAVSDFVKSLKLSANHYLQHHKDVFPQFCGWARGYCALSYSVNEREKIVNYIMKQKVHHRTRSFVDELKVMLEESKIQYNQDYLLDDGL